MLNRCRQTIAQFDFYLDDELQDEDRALVDAHLAVCADCRKAFKRRSAFYQAIRRCRPLYVAPPPLRERVEKLLNVEADSYRASESLRQRVAASRRRAVRPAHLAGATLLALVLIAGMWAGTRLERHAGSRERGNFAAMAVDNHRRHLRGQLPLEIRSRSPAEISTWFAGKIPFNVELPGHQESSGAEQIYTLEGARLVAYENEYAAYIAYKARASQSISLVITLDALAQAAGGQTTFSEEIRFHEDSIMNFKVITWSHRGLTYALVSDPTKPAQQSCMVCHHGPAVRKKTV